MKFFTPLIFSLCLALNLQAQDIVISEIMYNDPSAGADELEFIELFNRTGSAINLQGWSLSTAVNHTFPDVSIEPSGYLVIAVDSVVFENVLGVTAYEWTSGALNNGGETIELLDDNGTVVDMVAYTDDAPWQEAADGFGPSLELCDVMADNNDPTNWGSSRQNTGVTYGDTEGIIFATPGQPNTACTSTPQVFFSGTSYGVSENMATINVPIQMINTGMNDTTEVTVVIESSSTATNATDFVFTTNVVGISGNGPGSITEGNLEINIIDDGMTEGDEEIIIRIDEVSNGAEILTFAPITITIADDDGLTYMPSSIADATQVDADGVATADGSLLQLQGVVYGIDYFIGDGVQFYIIDGENEGINVFSFSYPDYEVTEGDEIIVRGEIGQFNGLTEIIPDTIIVASNNNMLFDPTVVTDLNEDTESQFVRIENVELVDPSEWTNAGSGFNVAVTDGMNTYAMRIDDATAIFGMDPPEGVFNVTGIGSQFDNSLPYTDGYQLLPRYVSDIDPYNTGGGGPTGPVFPELPISAVTSVDSDGVVDSIGVLAALRGIVYGVNLRTEGLAFTLISENDSNDGIRVFSPSEEFMYTVTEGDELLVKGQIDQFNGLQEIVIDSLTLLSSGNTLFDPAQVLSVDEEEESKLFTINTDLTLVDPAQWLGDGTSFSVEATDAFSNIYSIRIDDNTELADDPAPVGTFRITGIGTQFDPEVPFDEGYQIMPRYWEDIEIILSADEPEWAAEISLFPNPVAAQLNIQLTEAVDEIQVFDVLGQSIYRASFNDLTTSISTNQWSKGVYLVQLTKGGERIFRKVVKQ